MKTKANLKLEIKEITAEGTFEGILSPYGNVDGGADVVEPGAYTKTLKDHGSTRPLLWQHKSDVPIGQITLEDRTDGLWCKGQLLMELQTARDAYVCIKARAVQGLSIGFDTVKDSIEKGVRRLKEIRLYEGSIVTFPMNELAVITSVKKADGKELKGDFNEELEEIQILEQWYQNIQALSAARSSLVWSDTSMEEKVSAHKSILQQFAAVDEAFFPRYLELITAYYGMETYSAEESEVKARFLKAGAAISAANADKIKAACDQIRAGHDSLLALLEGKAGAATLSKKAAETPTEPAAEDHSADAAVGEMLEKFKAAGL
jgi:Escherichia/Staphylococcus phage prohead protease